MENFAAFILQKRNRLFGGLLIFTVISLFLSTLVEVNFDMTEYLPEDSSLRAGLAIMEEEFGHLETSGLLHVMFEDLNGEEISDIYAQLSSMSNVAEVAFDIDSEAHVIEGFTLYTLTLEAGLDDDEQIAFVENFNDHFADFTFHLSGDVEGILVLLDMMLIIVPTVIILVLIFFVMCRSWFEPIIFFISIGIAILINTGTNEIFPSISGPSDMIAGVLQVALSMDYAIIFLNRYRREKAMLVAEGIDNVELAMKRTIANSFSTVSGIAFTTILGMIMLVFMSFTIGADIGLVIAKSVFISLICVFGVLPALILRFDKIIEKTSKPVLTLKMGGIGKFSHRARYLVTLLFVILFAVAFRAQRDLVVTYSELQFDPIHQRFDIDNNFFLLYENVDADHIENAIAHLTDHEDVLGVYAYASLFGHRFTDVEMAAALEMDELLISLVYRNYFLETLPTLSLAEFLEFLQELTEVPMLAEMLPLEELEELFMLQAMLQEGMVSGMGGYQPHVDPWAAPAPVYLLDDWGNLILDDWGNPIPATGMLPGIPPGMEEHAELIGLLMNPEMMAMPLSEEELAEILDMDVVMIQQALYLYDTIHGEGMTDEMGLLQFIDYLLDTMVPMPLFAPLFTMDVLTVLEESKSAIEITTGALVSENFSRMVINTTLPLETDETFAFIDELQALLNQDLTGEFYLLGESILPHELSQTFPDENSFIAILTTIAFFIVVTVSFKSMSVAILLAIVIQSSVIISMGATAFLDTDLSFLDVVIVQAILKSRVIDYGILYIANYIEARRTLGIKEAIGAALNHSIDTILTSGLIIVLITFVCGIVFMGIDTAIAQIFFLIAQGCFIGVLLSVFVLPSLIAIFDRFVVRKRKV